MARSGVLQSLILYIIPLGDGWWGFEPMITTNTLEAVMYLLQNYKDIYLVCLQIVSTYHLHYYYHDIMYQRQASDTLFSTIIFNSIGWSEGWAKCCRTHPVSPAL